MTKFKICGLSTEETIEVATEVGASMIGLVFFEKSPRNVSIKKATQLAKVAKQQIKSPKIVALTVNPKISELEEIISSVEPDIIQLHGNETNDSISEIRQKFNLPIIKAFGISNVSDLNQLNDYADLVEWYLFDATPPKNAELPGGNGLVFNWNILNNLKTKKPYILSGGLNNRNVGEAIKLTKPELVDVSSGVESNKGVKDIRLVKEFAAAVNRANNSISTANNIH